MSSVINTNISNDYTNRNTASKETASSDYGGTSASRSVSARNLKQGNTLSGVVESKDGSRITIRLDNGQTLSAKLESNTELSPGRKMSFEVAKTGMSQVTLRPLYSNLSTDSAVSAALKAASLPVNETTVSFTTQMMQEKMPVNKNALADMARTTASFPNADPSSLVQMTKIGLPINDFNISQFENYKNFENQITSDAENIAEGLNDLLDEIIANTDEADDIRASSANMILDLALDGDLSLIEPDGGEGAEKGGALNPLDTVLNAVSDLPIDNNGEGFNAENSVIIGENTDASAAKAGTGGVSLEFTVNDKLSLNEAEQQKLYNDLNDILDMAGRDELSADSVSPKEILSEVKSLLSDYMFSDKISAAEGNAAGDGIEGFDKDKSAGGDDTLENTAGKDGKGGADINANTQTAAYDNGNSRINDVFKNLLNKTTDNINRLLGDKADSSDASLNEASQDPKAVIQQKLSGLLESDGFKKLFGDTIKAKFQISPSDVSKQGKIDELYERIMKETDKVSEVMHALSKGDSQAAQSAVNIRDNLNFMDQLNEFVNYVQLPLKMAGEDTHGELYVYTRRKSSEKNDGNFSALLHLDMEHLGPMDIHIKMTDYTKVSTHFYLQTEELLDFIESNIDELTQRLSEKGYTSTVSVSQKNTGEEAKPITDEFTREDYTSEETRVSKLCFDVRA